MKTTWFVSFFIYLQTTILVKKSLQHEYVNYYKIFCTHEGKQELNNAEETENTSKWTKVSN